MSWREVFDVASLNRGQLKSVEVSGIALTVCNVGGEYYAFSTYCSHEDALLSEGYLEGTEIECPLHGSRFDVRNGQCMNPPATEDLATFPTTVENGKLYVKVE